MKQLFSLIFFLMTVNAYSQNFDFDKSGNLIWQCTYNTDMTSSELHKSLCVCSHLRDVEKVDSTFYIATLKRSKVSYEDFGYKRMQLPLYVVNNDIESADVIIQYKEGKYRITLKNINLASLTGMNYGTLHDMAIGEDGYFTDLFMKDARNIYHLNFKRWLELESISNDW